MSTSIAVPESPTQPTSRTLDFLVGGLMLLLVALYMFPGMVIVIGPGQAGVLWDRFLGTRTNVVYGEGVQLMAPWNEMFIYDVRIQESTNQYEVLAQSGVYIKIEASTRFRPAGAPFEHSVNRGPGVEDSLPELHKQVGPDYRNKLVLPVVAAALRQVIGKYDVDELYNLQPQEIQEEIVGVITERKLKEQFAEERFVDILEVLIRNITLPESVQQSIQSKLQEEQSMLAFDFTLRREEKEAERKRIEASGIRDFQMTVMPTIDNNYLRWKGIEATLALARSPNSKVVVIGNRDGLPVILNLPPDEAAAAASPPSAARAQTQTTLPNPGATAAASPPAGAAASVPSSPAAQLPRTP